jgi:hypothetical protein
MDEVHTHCEISDSHGGEYEGDSLLGYSASLFYISIPAQFQVLDFPVDVNSL